MRAFDALERMGRLPTLAIARLDWVLAHVEPIEFSPRVIGVYGDVFTGCRSAIERRPPSGVAGVIGARQALRETHGSRGVCPISV